MEEGVPDDEKLRRIAVEEAGWQGSVIDQLAQFHKWLAQPALQAVLSQEQFRRALLCQADKLAVILRGRLVAKTERWQTLHI